MSDRKMEKTRLEGIYRRGDSYYWVVDVGRVNGKRKQETGTAGTLRAAKAARDRARGQVEAGTFVEPTKVTLGEYVDSVWYPALEASELGRRPSPRPRP